ncbi:uncharacterized protein [Drosophila kikkawai]|uniref:Uncharacterized protein n=1 Tax=Drosophila kikkawai TaxID=30033 RepID=A0A6P4IWZ6_DROKI|nr:uncharacterized protein LOC108078501 [Drosophila kikkawai]XP_041632057.1 uncharacterized protein LOC108078501 [Drosophila kikkawai]
MDPEVAEKLNSDEVEVKENIAGKTEEPSGDAPKSEGQKNLTEMTISDMVQTSTSGKNIQNTKDEDANPLAQKANKKAAYAAIPSVLKRARAFYKSIPGQENGEGPNKKLKTDVKDPAVDLKQYVKKLVDKKLKLMPKPVVEIEFIESTRRMFGTMSRRELEDLVVEKVVAVKKANSESTYILSQLVQSETTLVTYQRKIAEVSKHFQELEKMGSQKLHVTAPGRTTQAAGQKATVPVNDQSQAAGSMLPSSSGIRSRAISIRAAGSNVGPQQHYRSEERRAG